jgi:hypothetical protein
MKWNEKWVEIVNNNNSNKSRTKQHPSLQIRFVRFFALINFWHFHPTAK